MSHQSISLCMIARNESALIAQAIESVRPIVAEVIVVDTGSTDDTVSIAQALGAQVFHFTWRDDFSAARNLCLRKASAGWALVLDADEAIAEADLPQLTELINAEGAYRLVQRHYLNDIHQSGFVPCSGEYPEWERHYRGYTTSRLCRLFPLKDAFEFEGQVHEHIDPSIKRSNCPIFETALPIHHYGHTGDFRSTKTKSSFYVDILRKRTATHPASWRCCLELGMELSRRGENTEAEQWLLKALELENRPEGWEALGVVLFDAARYTDAVSAFNEALALDPFRAETHCNLAASYMRLKRWIFAEAHLRRAITLNPRYVGAYCNLGQTLIELQQPKEAADVFSAALQLMPGCNEAKRQLEALSK